VALRALGFVRASVRARTGGCGSGSSLTGIAVDVRVSAAVLCTSCKGGTPCAKDKHEDVGKCELHRDVTVVCLIVSNVVTRSAL
jgi:hypothetical protein